MSFNVEAHPYREFERIGWERAAQSYAGSFETITRLFARHLLDAVGAGPETAVLDVACGSGFMTAMAASSGAPVEGVDFSPNMVAEAAKRYPTLSFQVADAEALPFGENTFDAVVLGFGVHHFPFPMRALSEAHRVLRAGGRLGFTVWAPMEDHILQKLVFDAVREIGNPAVASPQPPAGAICEVATCLRLLRESGFVSPVPAAEKISSRASIQSAQQLITLLSDGTVRLSSVIRSVPTDKTDLLIQALERSMERYREGRVYEVPVAAILAVGAKP